MPSYHPQRIEPKWQAYWDEHKTFRTQDFVPGKPKLYVLDMFPYPSGAGLHVGHPEGYTATDIVCRYKRMRGFNVLHPMGWDAFGLPAEQYAIQTGTHPRVTTQNNITTFRRQIKSLGFSYDWDREVNTTDPGYYKWTQWIFLQIYDTWYDPDFAWTDPQGRPRKGKGRPIAELPIPEGVADADAYRDSKRLAYRAEVPVNWCPELGTVLANEEVIDGKSERGGHPVVRMPLRQWMLRITSYAERLIDDLEGLDWSRAIKDMQRNWVGRSEGAEVDFPIATSAFDENDEGGLGPKDVIDALNDALNPENWPGLESLIQPDRDIKMTTSSPPTRLLGTIDLTSIDIAPEALECVPESLARESTALPLYFDGGIVVVALPEGEELAERLKKLAFVLQREVHAHTAPRASLEEAIERSYAAIDPSTDYVDCILYESPASDLTNQERPSHEAIRVFTTRPDTLFGATYMVLSPEHPLVDELTTPEHRGSVDAYREAAARKSDLDRTDLAKTKTGVFTGAFAINPVNGKKIPIWIADYVLMGYGTGAIMAVPGHDERDFEFAKAFDLPIDRVVAKSVENAADPLTRAEPDYAIAVNSRNDEISLDGLPSVEAKARITEWLSSVGLGRKTINYKLRDWLFSRQRYWGEPFPVLLDATDRPHAVLESELPVVLPELEDFLPSGKPEPPLGKAKQWVRYSEKYARETNTMPQWAGSCWYYLRYLDPKNEAQAWSPEKEKYWMPVDLYVGGAEHAVLHLLYSRFWHKVLFDRGHVSTMEPFQKLVNQGMILGEMEYTGFKDADGNWVSARDVVVNNPLSPTGLSDGKSWGGNAPVHQVKLSEAEVLKRAYDFVLVDINDLVKDDAGNPIAVHARAHKMSKARGNVINPDEVVSEYGADSLRLYEMFMGPLEAVKPWSMHGVEGVYRFLGRAWRMIVDDKAESAELDPRVRDVPLSNDQAKIVARTVAAVTDDLEAMRCNTAISRLMEFTNAFTGQDVRPKSAMETFVLLLAPMAPHAAEELWEVLGHKESLAYAPWPSYDPALLKDDEIEVPVQVNGKLRARIKAPADADAKTLEEMARADERVAGLLAGKTVKKVVVIPGKLVNFVVAGADQGTG